MITETDPSYLIRGEIYKDDRSVSASIVITVPTKDTSQVSCKIMLLEDVGLTDFYIKEGGWSYLQIRGKTLGGISLWIPKLRLTDHLTGVAELYVEGDLSGIGDHNPKVLFAFLSLPVAPLTNIALDYSTAPTKNIDAHTLDESTEIEWETSLGAAKLTRTHSRYPEVIGLNNASIDISECKVQLTINPDVFRRSEDFILKLWHDQDEVLWLLSFLNKKYVPWYKAHILCGGPFRMIEIRREVIFDLSGQDWDVVNTPQGLIVNPSELGSGVLNQMIKNYERSPYKETILRAIQNLLITYKKFYIEAHLGIIYTVFEIMTDGLGEEIAYTLPDEEFKQLRDDIKTYIKPKLVHLPSKRRDEIYRKISELRRRPIKDKLVDLFSDVDIDLTVFWPPETEDVFDELKRMIDRRDEYIHGGHIADYWTIQQDISRIRGICSVWILKLLGCPESAINYEDQDIKYARTTRSQFPQ
jgi:hypothetical protein